MPNEIIITDDNDITITDHTNTDVTTVTADSSVASIYGTLRDLDAAEGTWNDWTGRIQRTYTWDIPAMETVLAEFDKFMEDQAPALIQKITNACRPSTAIQQAAFILTTLASFPTMAKGNKTVILSALREELAYMQPSQAVLAIAYRRIIREFVEYPPSIGAILAELKEAEFREELYRTPVATSFANDLRKTLQDRREMSDED